MTLKTRAQSRKQEQTRKRVVIGSSSSPEPPSSVVADEGLLDGNIAATYGCGNTDDDIFDIDMDSDLEALINECAPANGNGSLANANSQQNQHQQPPTLSATAPEASLTSSVSLKGKSVPFKRSHSQTQTTSSSGRALSDRPRFKLARPTLQRQIQGSTTPTIPVGSSADIDGLVWWQRYEPHTTDELALHAAKIAQVRTWLETATSSGDNTPSARIFRLLVLEGPPGTCKSTSVRVLGAEMGLEIVEWINPLTARQSDASLKHDYANDDDDDGDDMPVGAIRQFDDFLRRAERYSSLSLHPDDIPSGRPNSDNGGKFILIDDLPNIAHHDTREAFGAALSRFVATPASRSFPMVIVVTECFSVHQMLGGDIDDESSSFGATRYRLRTGSSNSDSAAWTAADVIPPSVYRSPFCQMIKFNPVAPTIVAKGLKRILQIQATEKGGGAQKGAAGKQNTAAVVKRIAAECHGDLRLAVTMLQISGPTDSSASGSGGRDRDRGAALDLFHALGKVLYAKRAIPLTVGKPTVPRGELESDPDDILDRVPVDPSTFCLFIHENYVDFCSSVDELADAAECLSESDAISTGSGVWSATGARVSAAYAAMLAVRGVMYVRDHPKYAGNGGGNSGQAQGNGRRRGARQMAAFRKPMFFDSYKRKAAFNGVRQDMMADTAAFGCSGCALDRSSAVLDVLPFWARIVSEAQRVQQYSPAHARLLRLATVGREDDSGAGISNAGRWAAVASSVAAADELPQKLVLSDDDIDEFSD
ncbi:RFC checkpoint protein Rad17 [Coemansia sp. RSA 1200]|nr:RFC checkpoint protein Rad17 [Coemansia sp. RSA 1200]